MRTISSVLVFVVILHTSVALVAGPFCNQSADYVRTYFVAYTLENGSSYQNADAMWTVQWTSEQARWNPVQKLDHIRAELEQGTRERGYEFDTIVFRTISDAATVFAHKTEEHAYFVSYILEKGRSENGRVFAHVDATVRIRWTGDQVHWPFLHKLAHLRQMLKDDLTERGIAFVKIVFRSIIDLAQVL